MAKPASANRRNDENKINPGIKFTLIAVAVLCVVMLAYTVVESLGVLDRSTTALTVGEDKISVTELNQYYHATRNNYLSQYGSVLAMYGYDYTSSSFDASLCLFDSSITWKEYFLNEATSAAEEISVLYQEAQKAGYTMTEEDQQNYDSYIQSLEDAAEENGYTAKRYVSLMYGNGTKMSDVEDYQRKRVIATGYYQTVLEGFGIGDEQIDAYYAENADDYDVVKYYLFDVQYDTYTYDADSTEEGAPKSEEEAAQMTEAAKEAAKADAEALAEQIKADGSNFDQVCAEYEGEELEEFTTAYTETVASSVTTGTAVGDWLMDESRKAGDLEVLDDAENTSMSVVLYAGRALSDEYTVAVRHILRLTETAAEDATEEEKAEIEALNKDAKVRAESILGEWKAGAATEDSFAQLAKDNSEDGSASQGGLYTGVYKGQMVAEFEDWCFDESRQPGDTGIVETSYGYHVMYFVENEGPKYRSDIKTTLESEQYNAYLEEVKEGYTITTSDKAAILL